MKKKVEVSSNKKKLWIILGIAIAVIIIAIAVYFIFFNQGSGWSFENIDYSAGTGVGDNIERATDTNAFDKLNPFR